MLHESFTVFTEPDQAQDRHLRIELRAPAVDAGGSISSRVRSESADRAFKSKRRTPPKDDVRDDTTERALKLDNRLHASDSVTLTSACLLGLGFE